MHSHILVCRGQEHCRAIDLMDLPSDDERLDETVLAQHFSIARPLMSYIGVHADERTIVTNQPVEIIHSSSTPARTVPHHPLRPANAHRDAVRFFHMDALSSTVGLKVDFDMA